MAGSFQGPVRVLGSDGILLTTAVASLEADPETGGWRGTLETFKGTGVAGHALVVELEVPGDGRGRAQLIPAGENGEKAISRVTSLSPAFF